MKKWELKHIIDEAVEDAADVGMLHDKETKIRKKELTGTKKLAYERLKDSIC